MAEYLRQFDNIKEILIPEMPHSQFPTSRSWVAYLREIGGDGLESTAIIGHSFGGIAALRLASEMPLEKRIGGIIAVSSPIKWVWQPFIPIFREPVWNLMIHTVNKIGLIHSTDDWIAPYKNALYIQEKLCCDLQTLHNYGHICCSSLPKISKRFIKNLLELGS